MKRRSRARHGFRQRITSLKNTFRHLSGRRQILLIVWTVGSILLIAAIATTVYFAASLGSKERIMNRNNTGVTLLDRHGQTFYSFYEGHSNNYVELKNIHPLMQQAVISAEDKDFYNHAGFSPKGFVNAVWQNIKPGGKNSGGSTLTQQVVKNALLTNERSYVRKYQELVLSLEIERRYPKAEILEMYLNSAYFGEGAFGVEDAAKTYFNKSAADLSLAEASMLAGLLPAPSAYSPITGDPEKAERRQNYVLGRMQDDGAISEQDEQQAASTVLTYAPQAETKFKAPHFALMVINELEEKYGEEKVARSGYTVTTTLDPGIQDRAETAVAKQVERLKNSKVSNGSSVTIDPKTGEVLSVVGSKDWYNTDFGKFNVATAKRQAGSSFKPLVYATGIENKDFSAATIWKDEVTDFGGGYSPRNYDNRTRGDVTTRQALATSLNIPAVRAIQKAGVNDTIETAKKLGLTTLSQSADTYGLPLALGTAETSLVEMTNAYAAMGAAGKVYDPQLVLSIKDKYNDEIFKKNAKPSQAINAETAYIMASMMSDQSARAATFGNALSLTGGRPAAVKTGTTQEYRDAWTIGFTPSLAVGVWIGNNDNTQMSAVAGSTGAAPIWRDIMNGTLQGSKSEQFTRPASVIVQAVCRNNGALARNTGDNTYEEYFRQGTLPSATCNEQAPQPEEQKPAEDPEAQPVTPAEEDDTTETTPTPTPTPTPGGATPTPTPTPPVAPPSSGGNGTTPPATP